VVFGLAVILAACGHDEAPSSFDAAPPDAGDACATPLDDETLANLTHSFWAAPVIEIQPGQMRDVELGTIGLGGGFDPVATCATWSIAPAGAGATIDAATGAITVEAGTASGTTFVVTADVESGRKTITADVFVYTQAAMPWRGVWREMAQYTCGAGTEVPPRETINEIYFWADGTLWVTWTPFEVYVDYWGTYAFASGPGTLAITADGGNYVPSDIDADGTYTLNGNELVLTDMWLGSPQGSTQPARCGHKLTR
jgi:hypothetical protein